LACGNPAQLLRTYANRKTPLYSPFRSMVVSEEPGDEGF
jgi:hypothetical protein